MRQPSLLFLVPFLALVPLVWMVGCSSSSKSPATGGDGGGGGSSGGGGSAPGCILTLDGGVVECMIERINGQSSFTGPSSCEAQDTSWVSACPSAGLVGCCTAPDNTGAGTATTEQCYYDIETDAGDVCAACGITVSDGGDVAFNTAAQQQVICTATGVAVNPGTWSATP
jgi:hypothetical protein